MKKKPHAVVIPFPAQGHVIPFLELSYILVDRGFHVTFVNSESTHNQITATMLEEVATDTQDDIKMVGISDGMLPENRHNIGKHCDSLLTTMQGNFEELLRNLNEGEGNKVTCMVADGVMAWAVDVAKKVGVPRTAALWTMAAAIPAVAEKVPALIQSEIMDDHGFVAVHQMINLSDAMPPFFTKNFLWMSFPEEMQQSIFNYLSTCCRYAKNADYMMCNSFHEIESGAFELLQNLLPIGPLLPARRVGKPAGHFWAEDLSCLEWLDGQAARSVIYVAFGSFTLLDQRQFQELALGLELTGKPFLWVVRPDLMDGTNGTYPKGFETRVAGRGKMVSWAPQQKVLAHSSVACFMSHCGWNSTMDGMAQGIPFLCWPYFADQFSNATYICNVWKTGLMLEPGEDGILTREEVNNKVEAIANDGDIAAKANELKKTARWNVNGGTSTKNFDRVVEEIARQLC